MTSSDWEQDVRLITFALPPGVSGSWQPGGIARIQPTNSDSQVRRFFELQPHLDPERPVLFARRKEVWEPTHGAHSNGVHSNDRCAFSSDGGSEEDSDDDFYSHHPPPLPSFATGLITPFELVQRHVDLSAIPTRTFFQWLRLFATDEREVERLDEFLEAIDGPVRPALLCIPLVAMHPS
jgi:sulfite reductase alpha subunit-like flavoprotein